MSGHGHQQRPLKVIVANSLTFLLFVCCVVEASSLVRTLATGKTVGCILANSLLILPKIRSAAIVSRDLGPAVRLHEGKFELGLRICFQRRIKFFWRGNVSGLHRLVQLLFHRFRNTPSLPNRRQVAQVGKSRRVAELAKREREMESIPSFLVMCSMVFSETSCLTNTRTELNHVFRSTKNSQLNGYIKHRERFFFFQKKKMEAHWSNIEKPFPRTHLLFFSLEPAFDVSSNTQEPWEEETFPTEDGHESYDSYDWTNPSPLGNSIQPKSSMTGRRKLTWKPFWLESLTGGLRYS